MNAYDFDGTIFDGDSTAGFFAYCRKRSLKIRLLTPLYLSGYALLALGIWDKTRAKEHFYAFLRRVPDIKAWVADFWDKNVNRIKPWYYEKQRPDDMILSASPRFLLGDVCSRLGIKRLICSEVDGKTGKYEGKNCHGEEKVRRLREEYGGEAIEEFYSDSYNDAPLARISGKAFCVKKNDIYPWDECFRDKGKRS